MADVMLRYMLDTDIAIEVLRKRSLETIARFAAHADELATSTVPAFELWHGAGRADDPTRNRRAVEEFLAMMPVLNFDVEAASHTAEIRVDLAGRGVPSRSYDAQIAAVARARGLSIVTGNTREFERVSGIRVRDWTA